MASKLQPEARPLSYEELTHEQHSAGQKAAELLQAMVREEDRTLPPRPKEHAYAPPIDRFRSNRVILLDGARGSGKSALLVTLLDVYVKNLMGVGVPKGFKKWIRSDDRIVPVGLIDLQPLPESSHLMLYLIANLERVVEAMEPRQEPRSGSGAPWHAVQRDEMESRKLWRKFARVASMGWDGNLSARKGHLDPEAFAAELQDEELLRLDVVTAFRQFVDSLVRDYRKWRGWEEGASPLFMLAIDDADMNPELSYSLLQLLRTLWHPRLVFLLTGDSRMFVDVVQGAKRPETAIQQIFRMIPDARAYVDNDARQRQELSADIYSKTIPLSHRCRLRSLEPSERLRAGPKLGAELLQRFRVVERPNVSQNEQSAVTLAALFDLDPQTREALPDRLRHLYELEASLRGVDDEEREGEHGKPSSAAAKAVERLWQWVADGVSDGVEQWRPLVRIDDAGVLQVGGSIGLKPLVSEIHQVQFLRRWSLHLGYPVRFELSAPSKGVGEDAARAVVAALMLAADYAAIADDAHMEKPGLAPSGLRVPLYAYTLWQRSPNSIAAMFVWPVPDWGGFAGLVQLKEEWQAVLSQVLASEQVSVERVARGFLQSVLRVGLKAIGESAQNFQSEEQDWHTLAGELARVASLPEGTQARRALVEWSLGRAGLLAAPESGLPADSANQFLDELRDALGDNWEQSQRLLQAARAEHVMLLRAERSVMEPGVRELLMEIDEQFERHRFAVTVETYSAERVEAAAKEYENHLANIQPRWLEEMAPNGRRGLALYLTKPRMRMLRRTPSRMLRAMSQALARPNRVSGIDEKLIARMWTAAANAAAEPDLMSVVQSKGSEIVVRRDCRKGAVERIVSGSRKLEHISSLQGYQDMRVSVWTTIGSAASILRRSKSEGAEDALEATFRVVYDYREDQRGVDPRAVSRESATRWWSGVEVELSQEYRLQVWPLPDWQTLREQEELEFGWNEMLVTLRDVLRDEDWSDTRVCDAIAYWFVGCCDRLSNWWEAGEQIDLDVDVSRWASVVGREEKLKHPQRARILSEWRRRLLILATPESGLSAIAARAILDGGLLAKWRPWGNWHKSWEEYRTQVITRGRMVEPSGVARHATTAQQEVLLAVQKVWDEVYQLRRERLLRAGVGESDVDAVMLAIDGRYDAHPWNIYFAGWRELTIQNKGPSGAA